MLSGRFWGGQEADVGYFAYGYCGDIVAGLLQSVERKLLGC